MKSLKPRALPLPDGVCNEAFTLRAPVRSSVRSSDTLSAVVVTEKEQRAEPRLRPFMGHAIRMAVRTIWPRLRRLAW